LTAPEGVFGVPAGPDFGPCGPSLAVRLFGYTCVMRTRSGARLLARLGVGVTVLLTASLAALGAESDIVRPPKAEDPGSVPIALVLLVAVVCVAAAVGANLMPSRRTHQD